jgi:eukaryotic-like serine/threonine-protein kinase
MSNDRPRRGEDADGHPDEIAYHDGNAVPDEDAGGDGRQPVLVEQLIQADEERRRLRRSGQADLSTIQLSEKISPDERDELCRMLQCAEDLEQLAALDTDRSWITAVADDVAPGPGAGDDHFPEDHRIGPYRVLRRIADGGFGAVLLAIDERNDRRVALKVPRPDILLTTRLLERFLIEGRAAATLNHPNIVAVYETLSEPVPAIAFEYCEGGTLSRAASRISDERTAVQIVLCLAEALQHAHTRGVLHRDVKPGNVLLVHAGDEHREHAVEIDGEWWIPKLGDFGLAKLLDESVHHTQSGMVMGTPQFMAPEQAAGRVAELGTHTDVFSLGAIFYWLLVGHPPFEGHGTLQTLKLVETMDAPPPRQLRRNISSRAQAVCLKCLRRPIDARYPSAAALAEDLRHLLDGEPVSVRPPSIIERLRQWRRTNPALAVVALMLPLAAALGLLIQWGNNRALQEYVQQLDTVNRELVETTSQAKDALMLAERRGYASDLQLAQRGFDLGDLKTYREALSRHIPATGQATDLRGPEWQELWNRGHPPGTPIDEFPSAVYCANLSADGSLLVASGADSTIRVYDTATWQRVGLIDTAQQEVNYAAFSSDGSRIASAGDDGTIAVYEWREGTELLRIDAYDALVYCVQFYDNDTRLASCGRHEIVRLWDAHSGELEAELSDGSVGRFEQLDVSDDGRWLAAAAFDGRRRVWDLETHQPVVNLPAVGDQQVSSICLFERDGETWMVSGTLRDNTRVDCTVIIEVVGEANQRTLPIHFDGIHSVAAARDGTLALAGDSSGRISLIDINAAVRGKRWWYPQTLRKSWVGHTGRIYGLAITEGGGTAVSGGEDGKLIRWETDGLNSSSTLTAERSGGLEWIHAAVATDGSTFLVDREKRTHVWVPREDRLTIVTETDTGRPLRLDPCTDRASGSLAVDGDRLFARGEGGAICCWQIEGAQAKQLWSANIEDLPDGEAAGFYEIALSADRRQLAICRRGHPVHNFVVDTQTGQVLHAIPVEGGVSVGCRAIAFDPTGRLLAFGTEKDVFVCDLKTQQQTRLSGHSAEIRQVCFVPDTRLLLSGASDRRICLWDLDEKKLVDELTGHRGAIECLGLHPHPNRLISADDTGWVRIWSLQERMLLSEVPPPASQTWPVACGADLTGIMQAKTVYRKHLSPPH